jgi:L-ascorbate metabolism protein UlaG (beta-lactamase superfamily)
LLLPVVTFVNHASVIFSYKKINLITDPWLFGSAFNDSWDLISESKMQVEDFKDISHIWFSHEHPDHFYLSVLYSIPEEIRKKITVLFQDTLDHRVAKKCRELGFSVVEMKHNKFYKLDDEFQVKCRPYLLYDSLLYLEIGDKKILNLNDCGVDSIRQAEYIHKMTGDVDLLLTQFGYAAHIGDPEDVELRKQTSKEKLTRIKIQSQVFNAKQVIPFASFVWFSHEDNFYMNDQVNKIRNVEEFIRKETKATPIILYPGDKYTVDEDNDNNKAIELFENDFAKEHVPHKNSPKIPLDEIQTYSNNYIKNIRERNNWTLIKLAHSISFLKTAKIYLKDLELSITFDLVHGINESNFPKKDADIIMDSDSLAFAFKFDFGADTLLANARFRKSGGRTMIFFRQFMIGTLNNNGRTFPLGIIGFLLRERSMWKSLFVEAILGNYDFQ